MKKILLIMCLLIGGTSCTHTDHYASLTEDELILQLFAVSGLKDICAKTVNDYVDSQSGSVSVEFQQAVKKHYTWDAVVEFETSFLREHYSRDEIIAGIKMHEDPVIQHFMLKQASLVIQKREAQKKWISEMYTAIQNDLSQSANTAQASMNEIKPQPVK